MKIYLGWKKPVTVTGKHQIALVNFAMKYTCLHSYDGAPNTLRAIKALVKKGLLAYYPATKQFKWHPVEPSEVVEPTLVGYCTFGSLNDFKGKRIQITCNLSEEPDLEGIIMGWQNTPLSYISNSVYFIWAMDKAGIKWYGRTRGDNMSIVLHRYKNQPTKGDRMKSLTIKISLENDAHKTGDLKTELEKNLRDTITHIIEYRENEGFIYDTNGNKCGWFLISKG